MIALVTTGSLVPTDACSHKVGVPPVGAAKGTLPPLRNGGAGRDARDQGERSAPSSPRLGAQPGDTAAAREGGLPSEVVFLATMPPPPRLL